MAGSGAVQLLVFDSRRGNREGEEAQKILAFHPAETPPVEQITLAGLLQGLLLFSANFSQDCWEAAETDKSIWVARQPEPCIWFALAAPRTWVPRHCTEANLQAILAQAYQIVSLLHGPIDALLQQEGGGQLARRVLLPTLEHLGRQLGSPLTWQHRQLRNPLGDVALAPLLRLSPASSLAVQNFCNALQLTPLGGSRGGSCGVEGVLLLHQQLLLWSTLAPGDSAAVYSLTATALLHPQSTGQRGAAGEASEPNILDSGCWRQLPSKFVVLRPGCWRPLQQEQQPVAAAAGEEVACVPTVLIQSGQERCHLLPYKEGKLWVLLLVSASVALTQHALGALQAAITAPAQQLATQVAQEIKATQTEAGHVPGYRFLYSDRASATAVATPRVKISAMLHHSRALAASVRESLARLEPPQQADGDGLGASSCGGDEALGWGTAEEGGGGSSGGGLQWRGSAQWSAGSGGELQANGASLSEGLQQLGFHHAGQPQAEPVSSSSEGQAAHGEAVAAAAEVERGESGPLPPLPVSRSAPSLEDPATIATRGPASRAATVGGSAVGCPPAEEEMEGGREEEEWERSARGAAAFGRTFLAPARTTPPPAPGANDAQELLVRSTQDCWAAARIGGLSAGGRSLLVVREKRSERSVAEAVAVMDAFADSFMC